jgi:hypothetical protein
MIGIKSIINSHRPSDRRIVIRGQIGVLDHDLPVIDGKRLVTSVDWSVRGVSFGDGRGQHGQESDAHMDKCPSLLRVC